MSAATYETAGGTCHYPCDDCGGQQAIWTPVPRGVSNVATLYECRRCGAVFTLGERTDCVVFLPGRSPHGTTPPVGGGK